MTGPYTFKRYEAPEGSGWWETPPGHWCTSHGSKGTPQLNVFLCCPVCKEIAGLPHQIDSKGLVHPSVVCPHSPCPMHLMPVTLEGWPYGEKPIER